MQRNVPGIGKEGGQSLFFVSQKSSTYPEGSPLQLKERHHEHEHGRYDTDKDTSSATARVKNEPRSSYPTSVPNNTSAPDLSAQGSWKYGTAKPPSVRERLTKALTSPWCLGKQSLQRASAQQCRTAVPSQCKMIFRKFQRTKDSQTAVVMIIVATSESPQPRSRIPSER